MGTKRLWVSIDRYGVMRPTDPDAGGLEAWKTKPNWLHWDLNPFHGGTSAAGFVPSKACREELSASYGSLRVQALYNLMDCPESHGGFHCVPGFVNDRFFEWIESNRQAYANDVSTRNFVEVPVHDEMRRETLRVPMRRGSLLIWNSQLPHG